MTAGPPVPSRFGAIDIGTNSVLLLVVETRGNKLVAVSERATITRLGKGVDATRRLNPLAVERTLDCLSSYAKELELFGLRSLSVVGTSALRDADGSESFIQAAERLLGVKPSIVSGRDEAILSFRGAASGLGLQGSATVFDVGGGSTEIIAGHFGCGTAPSIVTAESVNIGAVRLHERMVRHDPVTGEELLSMRAEVRRQLPDSKSYRSSSVIGVAGTVTTLIAIAKQLETYDGALVHGASLSRIEVEHWLNALARMNLEERRAVKGLEPQRADVILAGSAIVLEVLDWLAVESIVVSDRGLRWGLVEQAAEFAHETT